MGDAVWDSVSNNDHSIAEAIYPYLRESFRYVDRGKWEKNVAGKWQTDQSKTVFKAAVSSLSSKVTERAIYWSTVYDADPSNVDALLQRDKLMTISLRLKQQASREAIIRESREYFVMQ